MVVSWSAVPAVCIGERVFSHSFLNRTLIPFKHVQGTVSAYVRSDFLFLGFVGDRLASLA